MRIGLAVAGANRHDIRMAGKTLESKADLEARAHEGSSAKRVPRQGIRLFLDRRAHRRGDTGRIARRGVDQSKREDTWV